MDTDLRAELAIARRVRERYQYNRAVDIFAFARRFARIKEIVIPFHVDAIIVGADTGHEKPEIILNTTIPRTRKRFTIAHELGHLFIPWHVGTICCHTDSWNHIGNAHIYNAMEAEANRFASELLAPLEWIQGLAKENLRSALETIQKQAGISLHAAVIALYRELPSGVLIVVADKTKRIIGNFRSPGTQCYIQRDREFLDPGYYSEFSSDHDIIESIYYDVYFWRFGSYEESPIPPTGQDPKEILEGIVYNFYPEERARKAIQSINGIIGYINSSKPDSLQEFLASFRMHIAGRAELFEIANHPDFDQYLVNRIAKILSRR